ncbi:MAG: hypothetical protein A3D24_03080 [Candidatus Blackburnbacteria bacterium RIFCSPHIGHO2_02_FULL_39_13]|uniref:Solute-binding protein family 5 domain-containing protein n=1 Tax=Candidatus Blackburnbacteria bacterium RIFCSPLOWO2_01_FULL_40_20 TaxID=1797519 RepID=A0A1G1VCL3_9BACT|nr:MAG: hypothetical protein A2694_00945 [Candidatus Blackburnbacteria bacterium RIFCSPHIGHO2_01_FULL_40_17]OGY09122.1 MAG: hypothetical protein A3D24_03080 [Candidatus Blackburnbacteria bacterium RIFCSPHIGHO2_02_FULL_39_13]OGY13066.1 MAG: hypothetical protein A3A77_03305 [Candidatus Blackburnbacteria bacterium RIFCSPLOWO2_01_FULL_40_20]
MKNIRFWIRFFTTFWKKFKLLLLLGVFLGIAFFLVLPLFKPLLINFQEGNRIGIVGRYSIEELPLEIQSKISQGLTSIDEGGNVHPALASNWEAKDEGKEWVFFLSDKKWQDGLQIKATDINYKFSDVSVEVIDDRTIKFTLKEPFSPFPSIVSRPIFKRGLLGAGDWKVVKINSISGGRYLESLKLINTKTNRIESYKFFPTEDVAKTALKLGEVDDLENMSSGEFKDWNNLSIQANSREDMYVGLFINNEDPILSDKSLRQALAYAINKSSFSGERAISPISPLSWAFNPQVKQYPYNVSRAKELYETLPKEQRKDMTLKLETTPALLDTAEKIKNNWENIGIKTQIQTSGSPPEDFQILLAIQSIPPDPDQYSFWHSTQIATNITRYKTSKESQRIDKLLEDGRKTLDLEERKKIYMDFQRFLLEDSPVIFLYHPITYSISRK